MRQNARRALGSAMLLGYLCVYVVAAATIGGKLATAPWPAQLVYFAVAGVVWVFPLKPLFAWMGRGRA
ncbi:MAG: DUF2842 domain-containing protein [Hyphomonadaceae bacterium]